MLLARCFVLLMLCVFTLAAPPKSSKGDFLKYLVTNLPGLHSNIPKDEVPLMFAGQLELFPENNTHYFFWKYADSNRIPENKKRTTFWLNGGPGCSSMDGALLEAGPFRVNEKEEVVYNSGSWHKATDLVFVDQPAGTGFSFTDTYDHDLDQVVVDFLRFMDKYFEVFPDEVENEIYFAGESYAGQYIPYIADGILKRNKKLRKDEKRYNLKGLLIGNGWISPNEQSLSYLPYAVQAGIIDSKNPSWSLILNQHERCQKVVSHIDSNNDGQLHDYEVSSDTCEQVLQLILDATKDILAPKDQQCFNMYDYTIKDSYPSCGMNWPMELKYVTPFLRQEKVQSNLNLVRHSRWKECSGTVGRHFRAENSLPAIHLLPGILEEIPVILFNGNRDIICNYLGTEAMIKKMDWNGKVGFTEGVPASDWVYDNNVAGYIKSERNLTFVNVFDASHMVPYDVPEISRALMDLITNNFDIEDVEGPIDQKRFVTYPLGVRMANKNQEATDKPDESSNVVDAGEGATNTDHQGSMGDDGISKPTTTKEGDSPTTSTSDLSSELTSPTTSRITRLIQLLVVVVLIWGIYALYTSYKSRPSSIIKSGPSSGKKKNVQWADQLRRFQSDDEEFLQQQQQKNQGFLSKAINKFKGGNDGRGNYAPPEKYYENIEMGDSIVDNNTHNVEDFIIESEEEEDQVPHQQSLSKHLKPNP
jgi:carboxypeptidase D